MAFRPQSTGKHEKDQQGHWALFWEVTDPEQLPEERQLLVSRLRGYGKKQDYREDFIPRGPLVVEKKSVGYWSA